MNKLKLVLLSYLLLLALIPSSVFAEKCDQGGDDGCNSETIPASTKASSKPSQVVGNPISVITGNKYQREVDYEASGGVASLLFKRHYNSLNTITDTGMGFGWRHSFDVRLKSSVDQQTFQINQSDGRRILFKLDKVAGVYRALSPTDGIIGRSGKWPLWSLNDGRTIKFKGIYPTKITYPGKQSFRLKYQKKGAKKLSRVIDQQGRVLRFHYSSGSTALANFSQAASDDVELAGHLTSVTLPDGGVITYSYDTDHNLSKVVYPDNTSRVYHYEDVAFPNHLTGITDRTGTRFATWAYDDEGRANLSEHADGAEKVTLEYKIPEQAGDVGTTLVINSLGQKSTYTWKFYPRISQSMLLSSEGSGCATCPAPNKRYTYNNQYQVETITDTQTKVVIRYTYDKLGRTLKVTSTEGENVRNRGGVSEKLIARYEYEGKLPRPILIARPSVNLEGEHRTEITYNADLLPISLTEKGFSPKADEENSFEAIERTTKLSYTNGNLTTIDGPRADVEDLIHLSYDQNNRLQSLTQADGQTLKVLAYDVNGHPTKIKKGTQSPLNIAYDTRGQIKTIGQRNRHIQYTYDQEGRLTQIDTLLGEEGQEVKTESIQMTYDDAGRLESLNDDKGRKIQQIHDSESRPTTTKLMGSNGNVLNTISYLYDAQGRLEKTQSQNLDGESETDYQYDEKGQLTKVEKNGQAVSLSYNNLGQLLGLTQPGDVVTQFSYDNKGQSTALTDARDNKTETVKDDFGRVVQHISPDTGTNLYAYDKAGNRVKRTDPEGTITTYQWNAANKLTQKLSQKHPEPVEGLSAELTTFEYDKATGKLASTSNPNTTESFKYNAEGQLVEHTREIDGHSFTTQYEYNENDQLKRKTLPDGQTLRYHYYTQNEGKPKQIGKLRAITRESLFGLQQENIISEIDNDKTDNQTSYLSHNGLKTEYTFREDGQLKNIQIADTLKLQYSYDQNGNITGIDENGTLQSYAYDQGRLVLADTLTGQYEFRYDKVGNRISKQVIASNGEATVENNQYPTNGKGNRLITQIIQGSSIDKSNINYGYNSKGGLKKTNSISYQYNANQRPIKVYQEHILGRRLIAEYSYNSFGERVKKITYSDQNKPTIIYFLYDNKVISGEANKQGTITNQYIYMGVLPVAKLESKNVYTIHSDHIGTPRIVTNDKKDIVWRVNYQPFGTAEIKKQSIVLNLRFSGQYYDQETKTHYNYLRDYDPNTGRYVTSDPIALNGGINTYAYVDGNPINYIDPAGLFKIRSVAGGLGIHESILQEAFDLFNRQYAQSHNGQVAFSQHTINEFIFANIQTDLVIANQLNTKLHFDNPNSGPHDGGTADWIAESVNNLNTNRSNYSKISGTPRTDICSLNGKTIYKNPNVQNIFRSFGKNTHSLADFYAHSNWVKPSTYGGDYKREIYSEFAQQWITIEKGTVPRGLNQSNVWNENTSDYNLYSGQVSILGVQIFRREDERGNVLKNTHAYWETDKPDFNEDGSINFGTKESRLFIKARRLAVIHTLKEIRTLLDSANNNLQLLAIYKMTLEQKRTEGVSYEPGICVLCPRPRGFDTNERLDYVDDFINKIRR